MGSPNRPLRAKHSRGVIVGKFWPPHLGHQRAFDLLGSLCDAQTIVVCGAQGQIPPVFDRAMWIQAINPRAEVVAVDDLCAWHHPAPCPEQCSEAWAKRLDQLGLLPFDVVVAGEEYGIGFGRALGAEVVDPDRSLDGISSTAIRSDLGERWTDLHPSVRSGLHRRIVVLGAESTGTSTLAEDLSIALGFPRTAEAGRSLSWKLMADAGSMSKVKWSTSHFWQVIEKQMVLEHQAIQSAINRPPGPLGPWLVCDTDTLATVAWWERYLGVESTPVAEFASSRLADLYLVTSPEGVAFDDTDPLRDGREVRLSMHDRMVELVQSSGRPFEVIGGAPDVRVARGVAAIEEFERTHPRWVHS